MFISLFSLLYIKYTGIISDILVVTEHIFIEDLAKKSHPLVSQIISTFIQLEKYYTNIIYSFFNVYNYIHFTKPCFEETTNTLTLLSEQFDVYRMVYRVTLDTFKMNVKLLFRLQQTNLHNK